jgi:hypothetical protein
MAIHNEETTSCENIANSYLCSRQDYLWHPLFAAQDTRPKSQHSKEDFKHRYKMRSLRMADEIQKHVHPYLHELHIREWSKPVMIRHVTVGTRPCETSSRQDGYESRLVDVPNPRRNVYYHRSVLPTPLVRTFANAQPPDSPLEPLGVPRHPSVLDLPAGKVAERDMPRRRSVNAQVAVDDVVALPRRPLVVVTPLATVVALGPGEGRVGEGGVGVRANDAAGGRIAREVRIPDPAPAAPDPNPTVLLADPVVDRPGLVQLPLGPHPLRLSEVGQPPDGGGGARDR